MTKKLGKWQKLALWCVKQNGGRIMHLADTYQIEAKIHMRLDANSHQKMIHKMMADGVFIKNDLIGGYDINEEYLDQAINFEENK